MGCSLLVIKHNPSYYHMYYKYVSYGVFYLIVSHVHVLNSSGAIEGVKGLTKGLLYSITELLN